MPKIFLFFLFFIGITFMVNAQDGERSFKKEKIKEYKEKKQYQYIENEEIEPKKPNAFLRFLGNILKAIGKFIASTPGVITVILVIITAVLFAFKKSIFKKKGAGNTAPKYAPNLVKKEGISYEKLKAEIEALEKAGDYRSAIRNLYVLVISSLADEKLIDFHIEKTNSEYRKELPKQLQSPFKKLTRIFDYVWYGEYPASQALFEQTKTYANTLNRNKNVA